MARVGLNRLEYLVERLDRAIAMGGSDVTVNTLVSDLGVTVTAGGLTVTAGNFEVVAGRTYLKGSWSNCHGRRNFSHRRWTDYHRRKPRCYCWYDLLQRSDSSC